MTHPLDDVADVFCLGPQEAEGWRSYVRLDAEGKLDPAGWTAERQNGELLERRRFHARAVWQYTAMVDMAEAHGWDETEATLKALRMCSVVELRVAEVELLDFQLLVQAVGIDNKTSDRDELYLTAKMVHSTLLHLHDLLARCSGVKRSGRKDLMAEGPSATDNRVVLARCLCNAVRGMAAYLRPTFGVLRVRYEEEWVDGELEGLARRMQLVMRQLDRVVVVLGDLDPRKERRIKVEEV